MLDLIPGAGMVRAAVAGLAGAVIVAGPLLAWNTFVDNPRQRAEAEARVTAELTANFFSAMGDLTDAAEKARAARRFCLDSGRLYDIGTGDCREN